MPQKKIVIAQVNGELLYLSDFLKEYKTLLKMGPTNLKQRNATTLLKNLTLNKLIQEKMIYVAAAQKFQSLKDSMSEGDLKYKYIQEEIFKHIAVSDKEIEQYFKNRYAHQMNPEQAHLKQILVAEKSLADQIQDQLQNNPTQFESLAVQYSIAPEAKKGGDLGFMSRYETLPAFIEVFNFEIGSISPIIKSPDGFHIFKVVDKKKEGFVTLANKKREIYETLRLEKERKFFANKMRTLAQTTKVSKNTALLNAIP